MRYIGIRAHHKELFYSIIEENIESEGDYDVISISSIKLPQALDVPERLSYMRNLLITLINQYSIKYASIRVIEGSARSGLTDDILFRVAIEGVVQELFADSSISSYMLACNSRVASILRTQSKKIKDIAKELNLKNNYKRDDGRVLSDDAQESLVVAIAKFKEQEREK